MLIRLLITNIVDLVKRRGFPPPDPQRRRHHRKPWPKAILGLGGHGLALAGAALPWPLGAIAPRNPLQVTTHRFEQAEGRTTPLLCPGASRCQHSAPR
jgi:hypothetical protein